MGELDEHPSRGVRLTLEIWHPNCWTLEVTEATDANLIAHTVYQSTDGKVKGHFTAYADSAGSIEDLIEATRKSGLTSSVIEMKRRHEFDYRGPVPGSVTTELFVEYDPKHTISDALASKGFVQDAPVRVRDGREHWPVFVNETDRTCLRERLDGVRDASDATIDVTKIYTHGVQSRHVLRRVDTLSNRQREIFELACEHDYYAWPREITTNELAEEVGLAKTTLLEHLRKAEAKLLNPNEDNELLSH
ncbi:helix-turn-helix domain-containing protein [Natrarchaeobaculum sulfurireducens]|uniref:Bacterio-opsin activator HTH domain protein n=1 Tax=Natrarchaeobaculum sulfurireducens TaxID=2044521 RepID=A0A346P9Y5_9EURY|nr:helix-turn-helix domain-containing protein [Natrarchaeobaculum sulfurireducens]AXR76330.1 transcriptional regulator [Natrarchaeobaculum sulfurireducens]AXR80015.1 Bacterio-opsin activator HTH domain protein [Natrarchaeobaculum sulfurireducens]